MPREVDEARFERLLRKLLDKAVRFSEATVPPRQVEPALLVIYDMTDELTHKVFQNVLAANPALGQPTRLGHYAAQPMLPGRWFARQKVDVGDGLWNYVVNLAWGELDQDDPMRESFDMLRAMLLGTATLGYAFLGEFAGLRGREQHENAKRLILGEFDHVSQVAGSVDALAVHARHVGGTPYRLTQVQGELPELETDDTWTGEFTRCLALLVDIANDTVPPPEDFMRRFPYLRDIVLGNV